MEDLTIPKKRSLVERGKDDIGQDAENLQRGGVEHDSDGARGRGGFGSTKDDSVIDDGY